MDHFQDSTPVEYLIFCLKRGQKAKKQKKPFSKLPKVFIGLVAMLSQKSILLLAMSKTCIPFLSLFFLLVCFFFAVQFTKK